MAEPLRKDPDLNQTSPAQPQFNVHRYGNPNRGSGLKWWFLILVVAVVVWFVFWGRGTSQRTASGAPANTPHVAVPAPKPGLDVPTLLSNQQNYLGKQIHLRDVLVQKVNGTESIFIGPSTDQQMLVILKNGAVPQTLKGKTSTIPENGIVTVDGTVQKAGSVTDLEHSAKISRKEAEEVNKQGVVIEATRAEPQTM